MSEKDGPFEALTRECALAPVVNTLRPWMDDLDCMPRWLLERIRQIEAKALRKLRHPSRSKQLRAFIESV